MLNSIIILISVNHDNQHLASLTFGSRKSFCAQKLLRENNNGREVDTLSVVDFCL